MEGRQRLVFAGIAVLIAVAAVIVLAGGGEDPDEPATVATPAATATVTAAATETPEPTPEAIEIVVAAGRVEGGEADIRVEQGDTVRFTVESDVADHVHVHGYDLRKDLAPGTAATISFAADITGVFEVELEESRLAIASLRVDP